MNIYLHIGSGKTGTTSIQNHIFNNREYYLENGLYYPTHGLRGGGHHNLAALGCTVMPDHVKAQFNSIKTEIREGSFETVLLSSENFCFMTPEYIDEVSQIFEGDNLTVVFYVRKQSALIESTYLEWQKSGGEYLGNIEAFFDRNQNAFSFMKRITPWVNSFGKDRILARLFDKSVIGDDVCDDILKLIGIDDSLINTGEVTSANHSILPEFSKLVTLYDGIKPSTADRKLFIDELLVKSNLFKANRKMSLINHALQERIRDKYRESNKEFSALFLDEVQADILNNL